MKQVTYETIRQTPKEYLEGIQLSNTLGKVEAELMLGKILGFSLELNQWVAPSPYEVVELLNSDASSLFEIKERNAVKQLQYEAKVEYRASHNWLCRLFLKRIPEPKYESVPYTPLTITYDAPQKGFDYLRNNGFIEILEEEGGAFIKVTEKAFKALKK